MEKSFEQRVKEASEKSVVRFIQEGGWLLPNYESRLKVPKEWVADCWNSVDSERLKQKLAEKIEETLVEKMISQMATELSTDVKLILSDKNVREELRSLARTQIKNSLKTECKNDA